MWKLLRRSIHHSQAFLRKYYCPGPFSHNFGIDNIIWTAQNHSLRGFITHWTFYSGLKRWTVSDPQLHLGFWMRKQNWDITELAVLSLVAKWITVRVIHAAFLWKTRKCKQQWQQRKPKDPRVELLSVFLELWYCILEQKSLKNEGF